MAHTIYFQNLIQIQNNQSLMEEIESEEMKKFMSSLLEGIGLIETQPDPDFFQDDNDVQTKTKTIIKYSNTKVKIRNLLTDVSYRRYKPEDVEKTNFVIDVYSFLIQNLNPTDLDRKLETSLKTNYLKMIWDSCVPRKFSKFIYQKENFIELSQSYNIPKSKQYRSKIC